MLPTFFFSFSSASDGEQRDNLGSLLSDSAEILAGIVPAPGW